MMYIYLLAAGLVGGFLSGLLGVGGGLIFILVLPPALQQIGVAPDAMAQYTIANSLFATFLASMVANLTHIRLNDFYFRQVLLTGLFSIGVSVVVLHFVVNTPWYSYRVFNIIIIVFMVYMMLRLLLLPRKAGLPLRLLSPNRRLTMGAVAGSLAGAVAPLSGLGGGVVMIPVMNVFYNVRPKVARSVSLGAISITALTGTVFNMLAQPLQVISHYNVGYIVFPVVGVLGLGVVGMAPLGVLAGQRIPRQWLDWAFALLLLVVVSRKTYMLLLT